MPPIVNQFVQGVSENVGLDMTFVNNIAEQRVLDALETMGGLPFRVRTDKISLEFHLELGP